MLFNLYLSNVGMVSRHHSKCHIFIFFSVFYPQKTDSKPKPPEPQAAAVAPPETKHTNPPATTPASTTVTTETESYAAKNVEDFEAELELDLENMNLDENIDTSVGLEIPDGESA